ncbi:MAG TPA: ribonuclease HI family protein [Terriglobales bacterium]|jgi:ribonuclease HI|nr:ribonuclease HI family protein [Terriglobales bacterium]
MSSSKSGPDLFSSRHPSAPEHVTAHVDGGARGNPGPAGYGVVVKDHTGKIIAELSQYLGHETNNVAEYNGLLAALRYAIEHKHSALKVFSDSELMVRQLKGVYKVRNQELRALYDQAQQLIHHLDWFQIQHVLRERNQHADRLANDAMDKGSGRVKTTSKDGPTTSPLHELECEGIVRDGVIQFVESPLPDGTRVQIRVKR